MGKERSLVRASDIGRWTYCRRAWWLAVVKGARHNRPDRLAAGNVAHRRHGQTVERAARTARGAWIVLGIGLTCIVLYGVMSLLMGRFF